MRDHRLQIALLITHASEAGMSVELSGEGEDLIVEIRNTKNTGVRINTYGLAQPFAFPDRLPATGFVLNLKEARDTLGLDYPLYGYE